MVSGPKKVAGEGALVESETMMFVGAHGQGHGLSIHL